MNISKFNKGITLIALVITIVVLLILAGITLATLTGENGLFARAKEAKDKTEEGIAREIIITKIYEYQSNNISENKDITLEGLKIFLSEDIEIQYIDLYIQKDGLEKVQEGEKATHAKIKLKQYSYEYLIDSNFNIIQVNGKEVNPSDKDDENNDINDKPQIKDVKIDEELEKLLKEANMTITLKDILNTPEIMNEITGLIPTLTENDVIRSEENGVISYADNKRGITRTNSEDSRDIYKTWKAFDNEKSTETRSKVDNWEYYYLEYEFPQEVYAMQIKYIFTNASGSISTRKIVIQAYNEEKNDWEDLTEELDWTGSGTNPKEDIENLNYLKAYRRYRLYVKSGTNSTSGKCSGLYEMQLYGIIAAGVDINSEEDIKKLLLSNSNLEKITLNHIISNKEFTKRLVDALSIETVTNNEILMKNLPGLIPIITESDVIRSEQNGVITYTDKKGGIIRTNSEYSSANDWKAWKAFDENDETFSCSKVDQWQYYYLEYEFPQEVYAMQIKYTFANRSGSISTRVIVIQAYNEEKNDWEDLIEELNWTGSSTNPKENIEDLKYLNAYKRYRLYVKSGTNPNGSGKCSGLYNMQLYGKIK